MKTVLVTLGRFFSGKYERIERDERSGELEEGMTEHLVCGGPLVHLHLQALIQEVLHSNNTSQQTETYIERRIRFF